MLETETQDQLTHHTSKSQQLDQNQWQINSNDLKKIYKKLNSFLNKI